MKSLQIDRSGVLFVGVWSSGYIGGSIASSAIAPLTANLWRFALGGGVLALIARSRREAWPRGVRGLGGAALVGMLLFTVQFGGLYVGMADGTPASTTALIACSAPLLVAAASAALGWDRLSPHRWAGIALGVIGVVVTLSGRVGRPPTTALAWTVLGLIGLTAGTILQARLRTGAGPAALAATEIAAATLAMSVWAPLEGSLAVPVTARAIGALLWIATVPGVVGPLLFVALVKQRGATRTSSLLFVVPAVTALAAWPVLGAPVSATTLIGLVIAGAGLWLNVGPVRGPQQPIEKTAITLRPTESADPSVDPRRAGPRTLRPGP